MRKFYLKYLTIIGIVVTVLLAVFSVLIMTEVIDQSSYSFSHLIGIILLFMSGFILSNHFQKKGFIIGLFQGIIIVSIFLLINVLGLNNEINNKMLVKMLLYLLSGALGGVMGVNIKQLL